MRDTSQFIGKTFGKLTVNYCFRKDVNSKTVRSRLYCNCTCTCGQVKNIRMDSILNGSTTSCGCIHNQQFIKMITKHGLKRDRLYNIWVGMKQRCYNPKASEYKNYGGKGIIVCNEWKDDYESFRYWAVNNGYNDKLTIERKDISGNYCPDNCSWVTWYEQHRNTSKSVFITYQGVTKCAQDWCNQLGLKSNVVIRRFRKGLPIEYVLSKETIRGKKINKIKENN